MTSIDGEKEQVKVRYGAVWIRVRYEREERCRESGCHPNKREASLNNLACFATRCWTELDETGLNGTEPTARRDAKLEEINMAQYGDANRRGG
jgi:hypothetical protein